MIERTWVLSPSAPRHTQNKIQCSQLVLWTPSASRNSITQEWVTTFSFLYCQINLQNCLLLPLVISVHLFHKCQVDSEREIFFLPTRTPSVCSLWSHLWLSPHQIRPPLALFFFCHPNMPSDFYSSSLHPWEWMASTVQAFPFSYIITHISVQRSFQRRLPQNPLNLGCFLPFRHSFKLCLILLQQLSVGSPA